MNEDKFIPAHEVREMSGGIADMTLWRWLQDDQLGFPQPIRIKTRRYWKKSIVEQWLEGQRG